MAKRKRPTAAKKRPVRKSTGQRRAQGKSRVVPKVTPRSSAARSQSNRPAQEKAAVRSDAFAKAILEAKAYRDDPDSLRELFELASVKVAAIPEAALNELGPYLQAMLRLIRAYARGDYRNIPRDAFLTVVAAVSYLIDPFDLIPDEIPFLGYVDDSTVIGFAVSRTRGALDDFIMWETSRS